MNLAVAHDDGGFLCTGMTVGNGVLHLALLSGSIELLGVETFRPIVREGFTRQCELAHKILKEIRYSKP